MRSKVYWCGIEYVYKKDSVDYEKLNGGFVYAFIKTQDVRGALDEILKELESISLRPIEIEFISPYDEEMEWETADRTQHYNGLFSTAQEGNEVIFDDFHAYEKE